MRRGIPLLTTSLLLALSASAIAAPQTADTLSFEVPGQGSTFAGWGQSWPPSTIHRDSSVVHGGRYSARIERSPGAESEFSQVSAILPVWFAGDSLEVRGWLRTEDAKGWAGLWVREDSRAGTVQFDNMQNRGITGTTPWTRYRIVLPVDRRARQVIFGALLAGEGKAWADDFEFLVDGKPLAEARPAVRESTVLDTDHEFDAGSRIETSVLTMVQTENLIHLGKVWGFLKYHHPKVTSGTIHWDYELFRMMPEALAAQDLNDMAGRMDRWLERLGDPPPCTQSATEKVTSRRCAELPDSLHLRPDHEWMTDTLEFGTRLTAHLERIHRNRDRGKEFYVSLATGVGNPDFSNELAYPTPAYPDAGYRLLAFIRFWNIIHYWFPYRDILPKDWKHVPKQFVPRLMRARDADEYRQVMLALVARVNDGHANVWNQLAARPPRGECMLPVVLRWVEDRFVVAAFSDSANAGPKGLRIGDVIRKLDGVPLDSIADAAAPFYAASNPAARRHDQGRTLTRGACGPCRVTLERAGRTTTAMVDRVTGTSLTHGRGQTHDLPGEPFRLLAPDVAYLKLSGVDAEQAADYVRRAEKTRCFVIDIRNYPKEFVPFALGGHLVERETPFARFTNGLLDNPGGFAWTPPVQIARSEPRYRGRVVVLVDETSLSQAEYTAMALRAAPGAIVVGSTTAGADGNISWIPLPGGLRAAISGIGVFYPDRRPTQQVGIVPDLEVRPTIAGIRAGRDEVLEKALEHVLGRKFTIRNR